ncbi:5631_t:CDS:1 [Paraglomus occultum]|uniref:5631_t:CDS:1 n=1 Tax=Paraglomus occultum TaxID=144539 RepID=A0A9N8VKQ4_9GLOM|nr:5631_t:CDS:1 [Paraglomus occultum]
MATVGKPYSSQLPALRQNHSLTSKLKPPARFTKPTTTNTLASTRTVARQAKTEYNEQPPVRQVTPTSTPTKSPPPASTPTSSKPTITTTSSRLVRPKITRNISPISPSGANSDQESVSSSSTQSRSTSTSKTSYSNVKSRVGSLDNIKHVPKTSGKKVYSEKPDYSTVKSRIGSLNNVKHNPKGGDKKIVDAKIDYSNVSSRIGSLKNINHVPKGGGKKIVDVKIDYSNVSSRIGSLNNINHVPKGGDKKLVSTKLDYSNVSARIGSLKNIKHTPKGGDKKIVDAKIDFSNVSSRIGSFDYIDHVPQGGDKAIFHDRVKFKNVQSRVGSLDNISHAPTGGDVRIFSEKLSFREYAAPRIDTGCNSTSTASISLSECSSRLDAESPISPLALDDDNTDASPPFQLDSSSESSSRDGELFTPPPLKVALSPIVEAVSAEDEDPISEDEVGQLSETELSFEVNITRKSLLLAEERKLIKVKEQEEEAETEHVEPLFVPELEQAVEESPSSEVAREMSFEEKQDYLGSWI